MSRYQYQEVPIFSTGEIGKLKIISVLAKVVSPFQEITVIDSAEYGKCLIIDNVLQCSEADHQIYDREMLKLLSTDDKNIAILGGGDGYIAQMAIQTNPRLSVTVVELDPEVVNCSRIYLGQTIFNTSNIRLEFDDAIEYLQSHLTNGRAKFDGIACDLTDTPIGTSNPTEFESFYDELIGLCCSNLDKHGWVSVQAGASVTCDKYINAAEIIYPLLKKRFLSTSRSDVYIPSFMESCAFLFGSK